MVLMPFFNYLISIIIKFYYWKDIIIFLNNKNSSFSEFLKMDINTRNDLLSCEFSGEQISDINHAIESIPIYDVKIEAFIEEFEDALVEDNVIIKITVVKNNLLEGMEIGICHSLEFTELFEEKVSINLLSNKLIFADAIETIKERSTEHTFIFQSHEVGKLK